jgi:hypothetical protein
VCMCVYVRNTLTHIWLARLRHFRHFAGEGEKRAGKVCVGAGTNNGTHTHTTHTHTHTPMLPGPF